MPLEMLERRPDLVAADHRVAAAFNRVGEAKAARLPTLSLNGSGGYITSNVLELKDDYENPSAGVGASLVAPIYTGGARKTQVDVRTSEQKQAVAEYARMALRAIGEVEEALAAAQTLHEREGILENAVSLNRRALELEQSSFRVGRSDMRSVLARQMALNAAQVLLLRVRSEQLTQRVNLHLALGGSFEEPPPTP
jgi:outer membrane protein TolC